MKPINRTNGMDYTLVFLLEHSLFSNRNKSKDESDHEIDVEKTNWTGRSESSLKVEGISWRRCQNKSHSVHCVRCMHD